MILIDHKRILKYNIRIKIILIILSNRLKPNNNSDKSFKVIKIGNR